MVENAENIQTSDLGRFPSSWLITQLHKVVWFQEGPGLRNWQFKSNGLKVINVTNLQENGYLNLSSTRRYISWVEYEKMYKHFSIDENDIVIASSGNSYCKTALVRKQDLPLLMNTSVIRFKPLSGIEYGYMLTYLRSKYFKNQIDLLITGGAQPNFGPAHLRKILIPLPPTIAEQKAIATALNDTTELISKLEKFIAKKRTLKQGAMQELLKPKEGWFESKLAGECELITKGTTPTSVGRDFQNSGINFIKIESLTENGEIIKDKVAYIDNDTNNILKRSQLKSGDALFSIAGALGRVALVNDDILPANTNQALAIIRLMKESRIELKFLFYYLNSRKIQNHIFAMNVQGAQANLSLINISEFQIEHPNKTEQTRISQILSDMDSEIESLEKKLEKYRLLKQGMIQNLLTGKIRLI